MITLIMILLASLVVTGNWFNNRSLDRLRNVLSPMSLRKSKNNKLYIVRRGQILATSKFSIA
jgi:hypothetical protein